VSSTSPDRSAATPVPADSGVDGTADATAERPHESRPDEHLLIDPARVRRAPRYSVFLTIGAVVGIVAGIWLGQYLVTSVDPSGTGAVLLKPGVFISVIVLATTALSMLLAGLVAVVLDRRSIRQARRR